MELQPVCKQIYEMKYQLKDHHQNPVEFVIEDTFHRVAKALSNTEDQFSNFMWAMNNGAIPAGRIMSNAGASKYKPDTSLINCTVSGDLIDSLDDIFEKLKEAANTLKSGSGIGYNFSTLRPKGSFVSGVGADTSGPMSFADIYDKMCSTINSAGSRRGAQMMTFMVTHPDIMEVIKIKQEKGRLRKFNISILLTNEFMEAYKNEEKVKLWFPITKKELELFNYPESQLIYRRWPIKDNINYILNDKKEVLCKIYNELDASIIYNEIMESNYKYAEPGVIFIDEINDKNNLYFDELIYSTNPCGIQKLPRNLIKTVKLLIY